MKVVRALGFWRVPHYEWSAEQRKHVYIGWTSDWTAFPQAIVSALGPVEPDGRVIAYLRSAQVVETYRGLSHCRYDCGISNREMGHRELSDGVWIWPEGLAHYVERHYLPLPQEFLETAQRHAWQPPEIDTAAELSVDKEFWELWFERVISAPRL